MGVILGPLLSVIALVIAAYSNVVVIEVILHWLIHFDFIKLTNKYTRTIMDVLERLTEPAYKQIRRYVPPFNGLDFSPIVLLLALYFLENVVHRMHQLLM